MTCSRGNGPFLPLKYKLTKKKFIFNTLNLNAWVTVGGIKKVFGITNLGMRVIRTTWYLTYDKG